MTTGALGTQTHVQTLPTMAIGNVFSMHMKMGALWNTVFVQTLPRVTIGNVFSICVKTIAQTGKEKTHEEPIENRKLN